MKKQIRLLICLLLTVVMVTSAAATFNWDKDKKYFCKDTDDGKDIWTPGVVSTGSVQADSLRFRFHNDDLVKTHADDCDGRSENLKEYYCQDNKEKVKNIKCSDYGAVCVSAGGKSVPDYCECPKGTEFNEQEGQCMKEDVSVPEFGVTGAILATSLAGLFVFMRKK